MKIHDHKWERRILVTGGAGFIGANFLLYELPKHPSWLFVNLDKLTYAANPDNLIDLKNSPNYIFHKGDICDRNLLVDLFERYNFDGLINFAAETHVDRSIMDPDFFFQTNLMGTLSLLETARKSMTAGRAFRFHQVSTDEVYGSLEGSGRFSETSPYRPSSPYAASKASADLAVTAYHRTYRMDTVITNCSNNFGPRQYPEKLIPLTILNCLSGKSIPIYGDGRQVRDWLYVEEHCRALELVFEHGNSGKTYNISTGYECENLELVKMICELVDRISGETGHADLIKFVADRPGHDRRYALDASRIETELGFEASCKFEHCLEQTVKWYIENNRWLKNCLGSDYQKYYERWYGNNPGDSDALQSD
jgi:dTDP-glucose 4,6-dehydratase